MPPRLCGVSSTASDSGPLPCWDSSHALREWNPATGEGTWTSKEQSGGPATDGRPRPAAEGSMEP